ncbi:T9SS type A sorting domain-containing protein [Hymenobacter aquaticus]|uniref:T9SS type A sorting domain-containing protein n=1 Tax=Hymenobacter aquaticus TaxID=1867101 RepID=A0A4Z0PUF6_9BACT|nr:M4 family metallopeptidase [Hymenobacter aquaticus]TGE21420.1 T9SS type A sorting domain-containing protein [Hymenobacter aquaticus]
MTKTYSAAALLLLGGLATSSAYAQDYSRVQNKVLSEKGTPELIAFRADAPAYTLNEARKALADQLQLSTNDQMLRTKTETDPLGYAHERYEQYYKGVKVEHASYTLHAKNGAVQSMSGSFERISDLNVTPALSALTALRAALQFVGATKYMWQDAREEAGLKEQENNPAATYKPQGELVIVNSQESGKPTLAWKFNVYAQQPLSRAFIYVDAVSGAVVLQDAIIKHAAATATFATAYSGTRSLANETVVAGQYRLREYTRGLGIETYNCRKGNSYTSAVDFTDADNSWTEYNNANFDNVAGDAHFGAQATFDYWKLVHGRSSYDNANAKIKSYVHFDDTPGDGVGYENAYWNGSVMTYGDGASRFRPLTALDVCGHEIGHAVCEKTANLTYQNESGAMNEGFSDIWGAAIEEYTAAKYGLTKSTWLIGEDIDKQRPGLRSMSNPNAEGQPDTYKGTYWRATTTSPTSSNDYGGVHTNSGVLNHWFYRVVAGGSGTNDIGSAFSVTGIGMDAAAKIAYRTESVYLTASSNYASARTYSIQAATDLYGAGSAQVQAVTNAWYAVGVGAAYGGGGGGTPTTPTYCTSKGSSVAYEYIDYVALGTLTRTSGADAGYYNGTALTSPTLTGGTSQTVSVSAGFTGTAYSEYFKVYIDYNQNGLFTDAGELVVNAAASTSTATRAFAFTVPTTAKNGKTRMRVVMSDASATTSCNAYSYGETEDYSVTISGGTAFAGVSGISAGSVSNRFDVYPNPATDRLNIALPNNAEVLSVQVMDVRGALSTAARYEGNGQLNVSGLAKGMYTLTVSDGQTTYRQRFVKE